MRSVKIKSADVLGKTSLSKPWGARTTMSGEYVANQPNTGTFCAVEGCQSLAAAALDEQALCLDHFLSRCYQALEIYDGRRDRTYIVHDAERAQRRRFLEECSTQALNVGLRNENLNNLQRSRLLDVLLWAGELSECVGAPQLRLRSSSEQNTSRGRLSREQSTGY